MSNCKPFFCPEPLAWGAAASHGRRLPVLGFRGAYHQSPPVLGGAACVTERLEARQ
jgi:hypothetical protein